MKKNKDFRMGDHPFSLFNYLTDSKGYSVWYEHFYKGSEPYLRIMVKDKVYEIRESYARKIAVTDFFGGML